MAVSEVSVRSCLAVALGLWWECLVEEAAHLMLVGKQGVRGWRDRERGRGKRRKEGKRSGAQRGRGDRDRQGKRQRHQGLNIPSRGTSLVT